MGRDSPCHVIYRTGEGFGSKAVGDKDFPREARLPRRNVDLPTNSEDVTRTLKPVKPEVGAANESFEAASPLHEDGNLD